MTNHFSKRIVTDVLIVLVSVATITIAATALSEPIRTSIAASIPTQFDLAIGWTLAAAQPSKPNVPHAAPTCRLRSAPLQWNVDWLFGPPVDRG